jgi:hypothetical protein
MGDPYLKERPKPEAKPIQPRGVHERRMIERGSRAGYLAGRYGGTVLERFVPPGDCPYPAEGRPRALWHTGHRLGLPRGRQDRAAVEASYRAGLEQLEAGAPRSWA